MGRVKEILHRGIVPKGAADMNVAVQITGSENEAAAKLKRILAQRVLPVAA